MRLWSCAHDRSRLADGTGTRRSLAAAWRAAARATARSRSSSATCMSELGFTRSCGRARRCLAAAWRAAAQATARSHSRSSTCPRPRTTPASTCARPARLLYACMHRQRALLHSPARDTPLPACTRTALLRAGPLQGVCMHQARHIGQAAASLQPRHFFTPVVLQAAQPGRMA